MRSGVHRVVMAVSANMPIFEASVPCEVFGIDRSDIASPWYDFSIVALGEGRVALAGGFYLDAGSRAHRSRALAAADTLVVPGCASVHDEQPADLVAAVRAAHERGSRLLSICSGAFVLAAAGVLDGRRATTHWMHAAALARRYPRVAVDPSVLYIDDGEVITSAGTAAALDACLHVVRIDHGASVAAELARRLVTPPHRDGGQCQYARAPLLPASLADDWLSELLAWIEAGLHRTLVTADMAQHAGVSPRTLERRFAATLGVSPLQWLLHQRVRRAQQLLETTDRPIDWIATACGFGTPANMRAHFARGVGVPPSAYRRTFHSRSDAAGSGQSVR